ncbi:hypothetical protein EDD86DRAFT_245404 [Gorgonomyces haynaldii]|nr:hypothetical protein EDD86DRAFT_245404 [Gorgonomyces haynaldii]
MKTWQIVGIGILGLVVVEHFVTAQKRYSRQQEAKRRRESKRELDILETKRAKFEEIKKLNNEELITRLLIEIDAIPIVHSRSEKKQLIQDGRDFKQLDQVAKVCAQEAKKSKDVESRELQRWKAVILAHEFQILLTLNFDTIVELPHTFALQLLGEFNASEQTKHLAFLTMTSLVVRYSPKFIAYACVYLATLGTGDQLQHGLKLRKLKAVAQEVSLVQDDVRMSRLSGRRERMIKYRLSQPSRVPDHVQDTSPPYATTHSPSPRFLQGIVPTTKS